MKYNLPDITLLNNDKKIKKDDSINFNLSKLIYKRDKNYKLEIPIGIDPNDIKEEYFMRLDEISGVLICGETGSGKSNFLNSAIISLLLKNTPDELKFLFIDPRGVELGLYNNIPHLLINNITSEMAGVTALEKINEIIEQRKDLFVDKSVKSINSYNEKYENKIPHIVIVVDSAIGLFNNDNAKNEIIKILTEGYKFGIHLLISTSLYLNDVIDKSYITLFNYVLSFDLAIKDQGKFINLKEADLLTTPGEALINKRNNSTVDIQTPFISDTDIQNVVNFVKEQKDVIE